MKDSLLFDYLAVMNTTTVELGSGESSNNTRNITGSSTMDNTSHTNNINNSGSGFDDSDSSGTAGSGFNQSGDDTVDMGGDGIDGIDMGDIMDDMTTVGATMSNGAVFVPNLFLLFSMSIIILTIEKKT